MEIRGLSSEKTWDYENAFHWFSPYNRLGKQIAHWEIYKQIINTPGDIIEFGVYKGASLLRWATFREIAENTFKRKIVGFDAFGEFPISPDAPAADRVFVDQFSSAGGDGLHLHEMNQILNHKRFDNIQLIKGDAMQTLPEYLKANPHTRISLLHLDMDIYEPTMYALQSLWERIVPGGIVVLDDFNDVDGATRAAEDFFSALPSFPQLTPSPFYFKPTYVVKS